MFKAFTLAAALAVITAGTATAHDYKAGAVRIDHPWSRATAPSAANGAAYFSLSTTSADGDRLISAATPVAARAELHTHAMDDGIMRMRPVTAIEVTQGSPTALQPGGLHVMLMGLNQPLVKGKPFPMTLVFEKAGAVEVQVYVEGAGDTKANHHQQ